MQKIMVVEDEASIRSSIIEILEIHNYSVVSAENGSLAIPIILAEKPDMILCDVMMPVMDGFTMIQTLQKEDNFDIPFIFLTAKAQIEDQKIGLTLGAHDYIIKPFKFSDLITAIEKRFSKHAIYKHQLKEKSKILDKLVNLMSVSQDSHSPIKSMLSMTSFIKDHIDKFTIEELENYFNYVNFNAEKLQQIFERLETDNAYSHWLSINKEHQITSHTNQLITNISKSIAERRQRQSDLIFNEMNDQSLFISQGVFGFILESCLSLVIHQTEPGNQLVISSNVSDNNFQIDIEFNSNHLTTEQLTELSELNTQNAGYSKVAAKENSIGFANSLLHLFGGEIEFDLSVEHATIKINYKR